MSGAPGNNSVTNMKCRFSAMLVLWLGREFYRGKYLMTGSGKTCTPDFGDELGDRFGDLATNRRFQKVRLFLDITIRRRDPDFSRAFHVTSYPVRNNINTRQ
ncbi:hypothetical protein AVEN_44175-1 [Araneus ventricosus]|uniref:Uncharacterized protein n=1 Tax=Araneus ventricosus TaxID=182803 RepID=A0A4Y2WHR5_ARAVE|nr:hypothetical protein AVEN_44175-1 [Araneus ventricosus]